MTFEQVIMTVINEKLYKQNKISNDLHDKMQTHIITMDKNTFASHHKSEYNKNEAVLLSIKEEVL